MSTAEDVFWLYERNKNYYCDCIKFKNLGLCLSSGANICNCHYNELVNPITIGFTDTECDVMRKTYIKPGQECAICLDPIIRKSEAYLTGCGHGFHKLCATKMFHMQIQMNKTSSFRCPMCRCNLGMPCIPEKYNSFSFDKNGLDKLEDFWNYFDYQELIYCDNGHVEGMNKDCMLCTKYRKLA